jgi:predicted nucleic acid-binding Zn ribbon protein
MPDTRTTPPTPPDAVQTAIVRACEVCGAEVRGGRMATCSDRCRSERWRRRQEQHQQDRTAGVAALLREAVRLLEEGQK